MANSSPPLTMKDFLTMAFVDWQHRHRQRKTIKEFADYLGVTRDTLNNWMSGRRQPDEDHMLLLAQSLGSRIFQVEGYQWMHPEAHAIARAWGGLTDQQREHIMELLADFQVENARKAAP